MFLRKRKSLFPKDHPPEYKMQGTADDPMVTQEFFCRTMRSEAADQKGCGGYITVRLDSTLTGRVEIICPKCKHNHSRYILNGCIQESGRSDSSKGPVIEQVTPLLSAWHAEPITKYFESRHGKNIDAKGNWDAAVIRSAEDIVASGLIHASWLERVTREYQEG